MELLFASNFLRSLEVVEVHKLVLQDLIKDRHIFLWSEFQATGVYQSCFILIVISSNAFDVHWQVDKDRRTVFLLVVLRCL